MNQKGRKEREENTERENAGFGFIVKSHLSVYMGIQGSYSHYLSLRPSLEVQAQSRHR